MSNRRSDSYRPILGFLFFALGAGVDPSATAEALCAVLSAETGIPVSRLEVLSGFPPRPIPLASCPADETAQALGIRAGDVLTVRRSAVDQTRGAGTPGAPGEVSAPLQAAPTSPPPAAPVAPSAPDLLTAGDQALAQAFAQGDMVRLKTGGGGGGERRAKELGKVTSRGAVPGAVSSSLQ